MELKFRYYDKLTDHFYYYENIEPKFNEQFTGIKDKNGKDIYVGDILLIPDEVCVEYIGGQGRYETANHLAPVIFLSGSFGVDVLEDADFLYNEFYSFSELRNMIDLNEIEIVGNIYQNKDLLGQ